MLNDDSCRVVSWQLAPLTVFIVIVFAGSSSGAVTSIPVALDSVTGVFQVGSTSSDASTVPLPAPGVCLDASYGNPVNMAAYRVTIPSGTALTIALNEPSAAGTTYGFALSCFEISYARSAVSNSVGCGAQQAISTPSVQLSVKNPSSTDLMEPVPMEDILSPSQPLWVIYSSSNPMTIAATITWPSGVPASCVVDVVVTFMVSTLLTSAPSSALGPLPPALYAGAGTNQTFFTAIGNSSSGLISNSDAVYFLMKRPAGSPSLSPPEDYFQLLVVEAPSPTTITAVNTSTPLFDYLKVACQTGRIVEATNVTKLTNLNWNLTMRAPMTWAGPTGGVFLLCARPQNASRNTSETGYLPVGAIRVFDAAGGSSSSRSGGNPVAYVNQTNWFNLPDPTAVAASWSVDVVGSPRLDATVDAMFAVMMTLAPRGVGNSMLRSMWNSNCSQLASIITAARQQGNTVMDSLNASVLQRAYAGVLSASNAGRLQWTAVNFSLQSLSGPLVSFPSTVAFSFSTAVAGYCYGSCSNSQGCSSSWYDNQGTNSLYRWYAAPALQEMNAYTLSAIASALPIATPTNAPSPPPTPSPPATPAPPAPTPAPTVMGGCPVATAAAWSAYQNNSADFIRLVMNAYTSSVRIAMVAQMASVLCVSTSSITVYADSNRTVFALLIVIASGATYSGRDRMAAFVYDYYPSHRAMWASNYYVASCDAVNYDTGSGSGSGSNSPLTQLVVGVAVAGIISLTVCCCGLLFICCRRYRLLELWRSSAVVSPEPVPIAAPADVQNGIRVIATDLEPSVAVQRHGVVIASTLGEHRRRRRGRSAHRADDSDSDDIPSDGPDAEGDDHLVATGIVIGPSSSTRLTTPQRRRREVHADRSSQRGAIPTADEVYGFNSTGYLPRLTDEDDRAVSSAQGTTDANQTTLSTRRVESQPRQPPRDESDKNEIEMRPVYDGHTGGGA